MYKRILLRNIIQNEYLNPNSFFNVADGIDEIKWKPATDINETLDMIKNIKPVIKINDAIYEGLKNTGTSVIGVGDGLYKYVVYDEFTGLYLGHIAFSYLQCRNNMIEKHFNFNRDKKNRLPHLDQNKYNSIINLQALVPTKYFGYTALGGKLLYSLAIKFPDVILKWKKSGREPTHFSTMSVNLFKKTKQKYNEVEIKKGNRVKCQYDGINNFNFIGFSASGHGVFIYDMENEPYTIEMWKKDAKGRIKMLEKKKQKEK